VVRLLVSACLVGLPSRFDGAIETNQDLLRQLEGLWWLPVCPEQLGGLATPRPACALVGGDGLAVLEGRARVIDRLGREATAAYLRGARAVLELAGRLKTSAVLLRSRSPSCGPRDRLGSDGLPRPQGVTAALLVRAGVRIFEVEETGLSPEVSRFLSGLA